MIVEIRRAEAGSTALHSFILFHFCSWLSSTSDQSHVFNPTFSCALHTALRVAMALLQKGRGRHPARFAACIP